MAASRDCDFLLISHMPNVRYLTGFTGSSGCALVTPRRKIFFTDSRYQLQAQREVRDFRILIVNGPPLIAACSFLNASRLRPAAFGYEGTYVSCRLLAAMRRLLKGIKLRDASGCIEELRQVKERAELSRMRRAAGLADLALARLRRTRVVGRTELEVAWILESAMREAGSGALPFDIIVASGPRSAMPHGVASKRVIRPDEFLLVDLGASVDGYCSDMTRTFATGELSDRQREIYETVKEAQQLAVKAIKPGAACSELDRLARGHITAAGYGEAFGHSLGHGVGLEAHEQPVLSYSSRDVLEPGMTVTVEPGIYLDRVGGVRIEDTVLVGSRGPSVLTRFPRDLIRLG